MELKEALEAERFLFGEETIVSAAKHEEPLSKSPSAVTVIDAEDLKKYGSLIEALRTVPGLDVQALSPSYTAINIRQNVRDSNFPVLFLIDGRKMTIDLLGFSLIEILPVSLEDIERIEVIRGPGSALYGAALNGVINIITKDPAKTQGYLIRVSGGNFFTKEIIVRASGRKENAFRYRVTASIDSTNSRESSAVSKSSLRATTRAIYDFHQSSSLEFQSGIDRTLATASLYGPGNYEGLQSYSLLGWSTREKEMEFHAQVSYSRMDMTLSMPYFEMVKEALGQLFGGTFTQIDFLHVPSAANIYDGEITYSPFTALFHNRLTIGTQLRYSNARTPAAVQNLLEETITAVYLQDEYSPIDSLTILGGGRYDYNSVSKPSVSPRVSIVFTQGRHTFRASYGESFRKPSFLENQAKFIGFNDVTILGKTAPVSNPGLQNQKNATYELGYHVGYPRLKVFLDSFYTNTYNRIGWSDKLFQFYNDTRTYLLYGGEIGGECLVIPDMVRMSASYSLLQGNGLEGIEPLYSGTRHKLSAAAHLKIPEGFSVASQIHFIDERNTRVSEPTILGALLPAKTINLPPYILLNASASYSFSRPNAEIGLMVINALNADAYDYPRRFSPSVGYYGGERLSRSVLGFVRAEF